MSLLHKPGANGTNKSYVKRGDFCDHFCTQVTKWNVRNKREKMTGKLE
jgi:hypothetical protein